MSASLPTESAVLGRSVDDCVLADLLPQSGEMLLLDRILELSDNHAVTELVVRPGLFSDHFGAMPAWCGIELMAQTIAAYSGHRRRQRGQPVELGFLLGTRCYESNVNAFPSGANLAVSAVKEAEGANGMAIFDCRIDGAGVSVAAKLNVYLPEDARVYLTEEGS
jgi:predicted hotdog family 3-hydroxylacyl-ACP dehydratase